MLLPSGRELRQLKERQNRFGHSMLKRLRILIENMCQCSKTRRAPWALKPFLMTRVETQDTLGQITRLLPSGSKSRISRPTRQPTSRGLSRQQRSIPCRPHQVWATACIATITPTSISLPWCRRGRQVQCMMRPKSSARTSCCRSVRLRNDKHRWKPMRQDVLGMKHVDLPSRPTSSSWKPSVPFLRLRNLNKRQSF